LSKKLYLFFAGAICVAQIMTAGPNSQMAIQPPSNLVLKGTSTLHDFECKTTAIHGTVEMDQNLDSITNVDISIPVKSIHSESSSMDDNMYESLKADDYPEIEFLLTPPDSTTTNSMVTDSTAKLYGILTIAGKQKKIDLDISFHKKEGRIVEVRGDKKLLMTDFGIKPPTFMLGVLKTGNEVTVEFDLLLKDMTFTPQTNRNK
jgi:polyisoprenoid-binding protein YceI